MPTIRRCCIVGCMSNSRQHPQLQFFQFPKPENPFHKLWKQACHASLSRILPFKKPVVCALHFSPKCIGGRRLTGSAVPSLHLEVPSNLKAMEHQAMVEDIERSRKCAFINAVVFEWLVRANLNPQYRGSITHGMIKDRAEDAKQIIGLNSFVADNRWLNRFRETHLNGFAQRLAAHQLHPLGTTLDVAEIVKDLHQHFPPTNGDRIARIDGMTETYMKYMGNKYGEYDDDDDVKNNSPHSNQSSQMFGSNEDTYYGRQSRGSDYSSTHRRSNSKSPQLVHQQQSSSNRSSPSYQSMIKRQKIEEDDDNDNEEDYDDVQAVEPDAEQIEDLTDGPDELPQTTNGNSMNGTSLASPKSTNGRSTPASNAIEIHSYAHALEYLKPLEEFVLLQENFRAIGLLSQLEIVLRKGHVQIEQSNDANT